MWLDYETARDRSSRVLQRAREARLACATTIARSRSLRGAARLAGASDSDAPTVAELIALAPICTDCIARRAGISVADVLETLHRLGVRVAFRTDLGRCSRCLREKVVHHVE